MRFLWMKMAANKKCEASFSDLLLKQDIYLCLRDVLDAGWHDG